MGGGIGYYRRFLGEFPIDRELELTGIDEGTLLKGCTLLSPGTGALGPPSLRSCEKNENRQNVPS